MSVLRLPLSLVFTVALAVLAPIAQAEPSVTRPVQQAAQSGPGQAEFEAQAQAFGQRMEAMQQDMRTAVADAAGDAARQSAALDAVEARYQPEVEAFIVVFQTYVGQQAAVVAETERAGMLAGLAEAVPQLRSVPRLVRTQIEQAAAAPAGS